MGTVMPAPKTVDEFYAFLSIDENGDEGLVVALLPAPVEAPFPLIAAGKERVAECIPYAEALARGGMNIKLVKFSQREELTTWFVAREQGARNADG